MKEVVPSFIAVCKKFNDSGDRDHGVPCRVHFLEISITSSEKTNVDLVESSYRTFEWQTIFRAKGTAIMIVDRKPFWIC